MIEVKELLASELRGLIESGLKLERIWASGDVQLLKMRSVAVIGTRKPTQYGELRTERICRTLVKKGFVIVSGLATGVDSVAHNSAFKYSGKTISVIPTPIDECYPKVNLSLKDKIEKEGLVISQFKAGSKIFKSNFIQRNWLMAAISEMSIVTEASEKSGTRHQVAKCLEMKRPVGFLSSLVSQGFPWVTKAIESGLGFEIDTEESLEKKLGELG